MNIGSWLQVNTAKLSAAGIDSARLDCLILLEDELERDRSWLLAHTDTELPDTRIQVLDTGITRREQHEPLAYIRGCSEFYGRTFSVDQHVLEPRPETEEIISLLKNISLSERPVIIDVGTGSGALAVTAKLELPRAQVIGTDIDPACLQMAQVNADRHRVDIKLQAADLLRTADSNTLLSGDILLANLPYVPVGLALNQAAEYEPALAIFGGEDGLDLFRKLFEQLEEMTAKPSHIITEALPATHTDLVALAKKSGYDLVTVAGFVQLFSRA